MRIPRIDARPLLVGVLCLAPLAGGCAAAARARQACSGNGDGLARVRTVLSQITRTDLEEAEALRAQYGLTSLTDDVGVRQLTGADDARTCDRLRKAVLDSTRGDTGDLTMAFFEVGEFFFVPTVQPLARNSEGRAIIREGASPVVVLDSTMKVVVRFQG